MTARTDSDPRAFAKLQLSVEPNEQVIQNVNTAPVVQSHLRRYLLDNGDRETITYHLTFIPKTDSPVTVSSEMRVTTTVEYGLFAKVEPTVEAGKQLHFTDSKFVYSKVQQLS